MPMIMVIWFESHRPKTQTHTHTVDRLYSPDHRALVSDYGWVGLVYA